MIGRQLAWWTLPSVLIALAGSVAPARLRAQGSWTLEQNGGLALTTRDLGDARLGLGYGFGGSVGYRFAGPLGAYAGWNWFRFHSDQSFAGPDVEIDETGVAYGLQLERALGRRPLPELRVRGGLTYERVDLEPRGGGTGLRSDYDLGWSASALLAFALGEHLRIGPGVHYRAFSPFFPVGNESVSADLDHIAMDVAFAWRF